MDAGGKGFMRMVEGVVRVIEGDPILPAATEPPTSYVFPAAEVTVAAERDSQVSVRRLGGGDGDQRYPEGPCAYRHAAGRLYLCRPLGMRPEEFYQKLGSALSGTFQAAQAAIRAADFERVYLMESRAASLCLGLLALRAAELAESGWRARKIERELERVRRQSGVLLTVDTYDNLIRSGRVSRGRHGWLACWTSGRFWAST